MTGDDLQLVSELQNPWGAAPVAHRPPGTSGDSEESELSEEPEILMDQITQDSFNGPVFREQPLGSFLLKNNIITYYLVERYTLV